MQQELDAMGQEFTKSNQIWTAKEAVPQSFEELSAMVQEHTESNPIWTAKEETEPQSFEVWGATGSDDGGFFWNEGLVQGRSAWRRGRSALKKSRRSRSLLRRRLTGRTGKILRSPSAGRCCSCCER